MLNTNKKQNLIIYNLILYILKLIIYYLVIYLWYFNIFFIIFIYEQYMVKMSSIRGNPAFFLKRKNKTKFNNKTKFYNLI
jgi:hypothetical protein